MDNLKRYLQKRADEPPVVDDPGEGDIDWESFMETYSPYITMALLGGLAGHNLPSFLGAQPAEGFSRRLPTTAGLVAGLYGAHRLDQGRLLDRVLPDLLDRV